MQIRKLKKMIRETEIMKRNIKQFSLLELLQFYFECVTELNINISEGLPVDTLQAIQQLETDLITLSQKA